LIDVAFDRRGPIAAYAGPLEPLGECADARVLRETGQAADIELCARESLVSAMPPGEWKVSRRRNGGLGSDGHRTCRHHMPGHNIGITLWNMQNISLELFRCVHRMEVDRSKEEEDDPHIR
jgi:hypothetical protein